MSTTNTSDKKPDIRNDLAELERRINQRIDDKAEAYEKTTKTLFDGLNAKIDGLDNSNQRQLTSFKESMQKQFDDLKDSKQKQFDDLSDSLQKQYDNLKDSTQKQYGDLKDSLQKQNEPMQKQNESLMRSIESVRGEIFRCLDQNNSDQANRLLNFGIVWMIALAVIMAVGGWIVTTILNS